MADTAPLLSALRAMGAAGVAHLHGPLEAHLRGTADLLRGWGAAEPVCTAGLFHAVYGTDGFDTALTSPALRTRIATLIGREAEELVYLYAACDRERFYPRIGSLAQLQFADRFSASDYMITGQQLSALCEIIVANELEIANGSAVFRQAHGEFLRALAERMRGLASEAALHAVHALLIQRHPL